MQTNRPFVKYCDKENDHEQPRTANHLGSAKPHAKMQSKPSLQKTKVPCVSGLNFSLNSGLKENNTRFTRQLGHELQSPITGSHVQSIHSRVKPPKMFLAESKSPQGRDIGLKYDFTKLGKEFIVKEVTESTLKPRSNTNENKPRKGSCNEREPARSKLERILNPIYLRNDSIDRSSVNKKTHTNNTSIDAENLLASHRSLGHNQMSMGIQPKSSMHEGKGAISYCDESLAMSLASKNQDVKSISNYSRLDRVNLSTVNCVIDKTSSDLVDSYSSFIDEAFGKIKILFGANKTSFNQEQLSFFLNRIGLIGDLHENWKCKNQQDETFVGILFKGLRINGQAELDFASLRGFLATSNALHKQRVWPFNELSNEKSTIPEVKRSSSLSNKQKSTKNIFSMASKIMSTNEENTNIHQKINTNNKTVTFESSHKKSSGVQYTPCTKESKCLIEYQDQSKIGSPHEPEMQFSFRKLNNSDEGSTEIVGNGLIFSEIEYQSIKPERAARRNSGKIKIEYFEDTPSIDNKEHNPLIQLCSERPSKEASSPRHNPQYPNPNWITDSNFFPTSTEGCEESERDTGRKSVHDQYTEQILNLKDGATDRGALLFCADINFNDDRKKINIYANDDICKVAEKFVKDNQLNDKMLEKLVRVLKDKHELVLFEYGT